MTHINIVIFQGGIPMFLIWLLCLAALLVVPAIMVYCGYIRQNLCSKIGAKFGYRSALSLSSAEAWAFAQKNSVKRYIVAGAITGVIAIALMLPTIGLHAAGLLSYSVTLLLFELLTWGFIIISVESGLRTLLGVKES